MGKSRVRVKQVGGGGPKMPTNPLADLVVPPDEMIHLPPKPDSNSGFMIWPMGETAILSVHNFQYSLTVTVAIICPALLL
jgi:hypothetical protein